MLMIVGLAAIGVDVGHLAFTANETQNLADVAATAYIQTMADNLENETNDNPTTDTRTAVEANAIGGNPATLDDNIESLIEGNYDFDGGRFVPNGMPRNAVQAMAVVTVDNIFAGVFGADTLTSTVRRTAVAALGPPRTAENLLPIAVEACHFPTVMEGDCEDLPSFDRIPAVDSGAGDSSAVDTHDGGEDSCFTSFGTSPASKTTVESYFPDDQCQLAGSASIGDTIHVIKGELGGLAKTALPKVLEACAALDPSITTFTVPIIPCGKCNGGDSQEIVGFAEIKIEEIGPPPGREIQAASICKTEPTSGGPSDGLFGGIVVHALVE
jgi:hypothetical protein